MNAPSDPRPHYIAATRWVTNLMDGVPADRLHAPTPCTEFDVSALMGHLIGTARRSRALSRGEDIFAVAMSSDHPSAAEYASVVAEAVDSWSDDARLTALVRVPWGEVPGAGALWGYVNETLVHGWDLAVATGQPAEVETAAAEAAITVARQFIPAEIRADDDVPFGPVVEPRPDAGATERLANWSGRTHPALIAAPVE